MEIRAFAPLYTKASASANGSLWPSVTVAGTTTAASANLPGLTSSSDSNQILISNTTTAWAYVNFGLTGAVTAATVAAGLPVPPGASATVSVDSEVGAVSVILSTGTGNVIFTRGEGI